MLTIIHHNDPDGWASAAVVLYYHKVNKFLVELNLVEMDYKGEIPYESIAKDSDVVIVDYSLSVEEMDKLQERTRKIMWVDHHPRSLELVGKYKYPIPTTSLSTEKAACELTWELLFPGSKTPRAITLISDRDAWLWRHGTETELFHAGLMSVDINPMSPIWDRLLDDSNGDVYDIQLRGTIVLDFQKMLCEKARQEAGYEATLEGLNCFVINAVTMMGSETFGELVKKYPICALIVWEGTEWKVTLYSATGVNVRVFAEKFGGGGHISAAGFRCKELPFKV